MPVVAGKKVVMRLAGFFFFYCKSTSDYLQVHDATTLTTTQQTWQWWQDDEGDNKDMTFYFYLVFFYCKFTDNYLQVD
jgi:hypothetical protein